MALDPFQQISNNPNMKTQLITMIVDQLNKNKEKLKQDFSSQHSIPVARHFALDNLLPNEVANEIYANFPNLKKMRTLHSYGELKLKYSHIRNTTNLLQDLHHAFQDTKVVAVIEEITGIKNQVPDNSRLSGGVSALLKGNYINPHLDNSHDIDRKLYRTVNLLYYLSPDWKIENGGNYELWDVTVNHRIIVPSFFNRLVVMETNQTSWHAVNPVLCDTPRRCMFNYYFSENSPENMEYFHTSSMFFNRLIKSRPEQKVRRKLAEIRDAIFTRFTF